MKHIYKLFLYLIIFGFIFSGCRVEAEQKITPTSASIVIGYCPSMHPYIQKLLNNHNDIEAIQFENSAMAIQSLKSGTVHTILIGRIARENELNQDFQHSLLKDGVTLITKNQSVILYENLKHVNIFTPEEISEAQKILPMGTSITHIQGLEKTLSIMDGTSAILLHWSEVPAASYQLLIPVDGQGNKIPDFRSPHLYYQPELKEDLSLIIDEISSD